MCIKSVSISDLDRDKNHINVAFLGNVSAGKTTLLNALLMDKYGEVSMNRCTASVSYFHFSNSASKTSSPKNSAVSVHDKIAASNKVNRKKTRVEEKHFSVEGTEHFVSIHDELSPEIILVDVPGLNENSTSQVYKDHVRNKFHTFSAVIIVMDATQGVNTTEQVDLLKFVHRCNQETRNVPIMIMMNKVDPDEKDNDELLTMVEEIKEEARNIFGSDNNVRCIPISAEYSYIYRSAARLNKDEFISAFDKGSRCMNKIGKEEFGRQWNKMPKADKVNEIYDIVNNKEEYAERLEECNFHLLLDTLEDFIGKDKQHYVIYKQIQYLLQNTVVRKDISKSSVNFEANFYDEMMICLNNTKALGMLYADKECVGEYHQRFWDLWNELQQIALKLFKVNPDARWMLVLCGDILSKYGTEMLSELYAIDGNGGKKQELKNVKSTFKSLITSKNEIIWANAVYHKYGFEYDNSSDNEYKYAAQWHKLSPGDWHFLLVSSSLMSCEPVFVYEFASSIAQMRYHELQFSRIFEGCFHSVESRNGTLNVEFKSETVQMCTRCSKRLSPVNGACVGCGYSSSVQSRNISIPKSISVPVVSDSCAKCIQKTKLNDVGFCEKCKHCSSCGTSNLITYACNNCSSSIKMFGSDDKFYCSSCKLCNGCGYFIDTAGYARDFKITSPSKIIDSYKKLGISIDMKNFKNTSWFKAPVSNEPSEKEFINKYPKSAMLTSPKDEDHWAHLDFIFAILMKDKSYLIV